MLRMSFFDGTLDRERAIDVISKSDKPCVYTFGFKYRNPTTYKVPVSKEKAIGIINKEPLLDVSEYEDVIDLNAYSGNDMW